MIIYKFKPLNFSAPVKLLTEINGNCRNYHYLKNSCALLVKDNGFKGETGYILQEANSTSILIGLATRDILSPADGGLIKEKRQLSLANKIITEYELNVKEGQGYSLCRYLSVYTSLDLEIEDMVVADPGNLKKRIITTVNTAVQNGWKGLLQRHIDYMRDYWNDVDVKIYGDTALQQAFRFNAFHLLQSTGRNGWTNIAAKGLSGEFYEGHYFWDTETYIIPFFLYSRPEIARSLIMYRYHNLDKARANARRMKLRGALYPWRTINGEEASGNFMGSTVQYHINADIAYSIYQYFSATTDTEFLYNYGAEILIETARMWADRGGFIPLKGNKFCINEVCGPDEYKPGVNNNCYTNYMARFNLELAVDVLKEMAGKEPQLYKNLEKRVDLQVEELDNWARIAENMYLPFNQELGIHPQDDSFLYKEVIDVDAIPTNEIALVQNWHPLIIWRYQVIKQADVILLMLLLGDQFTREEKKANYDYYEPKTTHDSSLSPAIYSIIANEIGYNEQAYNYFMMTARLDLDDFNKNTYQGVHTACMAGSWLALIQGFAGMRNYRGKLYFNPKIPRKWDGFEFKMKFRGRQIKIDIKGEKTAYQLLGGDNIRIYHKGKEVELISGEKIIFS